MGLLRMSTIFKHLNANPDSRCVTEGEEVLFAKQLIMCGLSNVDNLVYYIIALCLQTSAISEKPHEINGSFTLNEDESFNINTFTCTCKAGQSGVCKHVSACLFYCNRNDISSLEKLTSTDVECYWDKTKSSVEETYRPKPILQYECLRGVKRVRELLPEEEDLCLEELRSADHSSALYKHFSRTYGGTSTTTTVASTSSCEETEITETVKTILAHAKRSDFLKKIEGYSSASLRPCCKNILQMLSLHNCERAATVMQHSDEWKELRKLRITGSTCYLLYTYSKQDWEKKAKTLFYPKPFSSKYTEHGNTYEKAALLKYKETCEVGDEIVELGILICHFYRWLGFSPDGIVMRGGKPIKLIEIKCPYSGVTEDATEFIHSCKYIQTVGENINLKKKHAYYGQIQLDLALLNLQECDLILYSSMAKNFL